MTKRVSRAEREAVFDAAMRLYAADCSPKIPHPAPRWVRPLVYLYMACARAARDKR